jgi:uncharacterized protein YoxC
MFNCFRGSEAERLRRLERMFGIIMRNQERILAELKDVQNILNDVATAVDKISGETRSLLDKINQLETADPTQQALVDSIAAQAQGIADKLKAVDDLVPDATPPQPAEGTGDETAAG